MQRSGAILLPFAPLQYVLIFRPEEIPSSIPHEFSISKRTSWCRPGTTPLKRSSDLQIAFARSKLLVLCQFPFGVVETLLSVPRAVSVVIFLLSDSDTLVDALLLQ